ncbi:hypothetical protein [Clostridium sp. Marseille-P299]|uniref:hypothetical protein n=1 Tax=Clostridium sp. Marseille-P299 TaxID=1805477 RepID=UPI00082B5FAF|nr:hypothetical protein [Clostridium sp. Marseille-P299]
MKIANNLSDNEKKLLFLLFTLLILFSAYQFGFVKFTDKAEELQKENLTLSSKVNELQIKKNQEEKFMNETLEYEGKMNEILGAFPVWITQEKNLMLITELEEYANVKISSVTFQDVSTFYTASLENESSVSDVNDITGYTTSIALTYQASYQGLKDCIQFINNNEEKMNITDISAAFDNTTGNLTGTLTISVYALDGIEKSEEKLVIPGIDLGMDNIFGSFEIKDVVND